QQGCGRQERPGQRPNPPGEHGSPEKHRARVGADPEAHAVPNRQLAGVPAEDVPGLRHSAKQEDQNRRVEMKTGVDDKRKRNQRRGQQHGLECHFPTSPAGRTNNTAMKTTKTNNSLNVGAISAPSTFSTRPMHSPPTSAPLTVPNPPSTT